MRQNARVWILIGIGIAGIAASLAPAARAAGTPAEKQLEQKMVALLNLDRSREGLGPLIWDELLAKVARGHSHEMATLGYFAHKSPRTGLPSDRVFAAGIQVQATGENIAKDDSIEDAEVRLMHSPPHRANILSPVFTHVGIGVDQVGSTILVTQEFSKPVPEVKPVDECDSMLARINAIRSMGGLRTFSRDVGLDAIAWDLAEEMNQKQQLLPRRALGMLRERGIKYAAASAWVGLDSSDDPVAALKEVRDKHWSSVGIGVSINRTKEHGLGMMWMAVVFARLRR